MSGDKLGDKFSQCTDIFVIGCPEQVSSLRGAETYESKCICQRACETQPQIHIQQHYTTLDSFPLTDETNDS